MYPVISRHSGQSWHERFKKNAGSMEHRITYYKREGIDENLKTKKEREAGTKRQAGRAVMATSQEPVHKRQKVAVELQKEDKRQNGSGSGSGEQEQVAVEVPPVTVSAETSQPSAEEISAETNPKPTGTPKPRQEVQSEQSVPLDGDTRRSVAEREGARLTKLAAK